MPDRPPDAWSFDPVAWTMRVTRRFLAIAVPRICRVKLVVRGIEQLGGLVHPGRPMILASNHHSILDTPVILELLPRAIRSRTAVVSAIDVFGRVRRGPLHRRLTSWLIERLVCDGYFAILVDRGSAEGFRRIRRNLDLGWNVLLYPEGTRSRSGALGRFQSGAALLARETGAAVVPLWVSGSTAVLPIGTRWPRPGTVDVTVGTALEIGSTESPEEFTRRLREAVAQLGALRVESAASTAAPALAGGRTDG